MRGSSLVSLEFDPLQAQNQKPNLKRGKRSRRKWTERIFKPIIIRAQFHLIPMETRSSFLRRCTIESVVNSAWEHSR
uniref:Uncharacterized protein n=1 Tax=Rhizophora mucronata TaxID=61149 RepID=A0A2P2Q575_RHIMU